MRAQDVMRFSPIVPVVAIEKVEDALPLAQALLEGDIDIMEITLRTTCALECIEVISKALPQMHVGAGTVINEQDFQNALGVGSQFVFSPGISQELLDVASKSEIPFIPGVASASEIMLAQNSGFEHCKLFPALSVGGVSVLKAFAGPFGRVKFCPTGGISLENMNDFLSLPNVLCVGGSWIVPKNALKEKNFIQITKLCKEALSAIKSSAT